MGFLSERCPNCGNPLSKDAQYCNSCGCPSATSWSSCPQCSASVGGDSKFCWKCGGAQTPDQRKAFYSDRWHRSPSDFAARVDIQNPKEALHHGLQVDDGTLALVFQNGQFHGQLEPGYHTLDSFFQRLLGLDGGRQCHAILLDMQSAEVDFVLPELRTDQQIPIDARLRLLFQVSDAKLFVAQLISTHTASFSTQDLSNRFYADVRNAVQTMVADKKVDDLMIEMNVREMIEGSLQEKLQPLLATFGLTIVGVRLADFGGPAIDAFKEKLGEISRLSREYDINRRLRDALRAEKVSAYRDEEMLRDEFEQVTHELGFNRADREAQAKRFLQAAEHKTQLEGLQQDYERRKSEISNRLDEQKLRHQSEILETRHEIEGNRLKFDEEIHQQRTRAELGREQQVEQAKTDVELAKQGVEALRLVKEAKLSLKKKEDEQELQREADILKLRGASNFQALLSTLSGEQADRILKLAELEMRKGLSPEQALTMIAEKSPEIAPAVAEALKARYQSENR